MPLIAPVPLDALPPDLAEAVARAWVDARVARIYGGTSEIMKEIIARSL